MSKETKNTEPAQKSEILATREARTDARKAKTEATKITRDADRLARTADDAATILAAADISGKIPVTFARKILRMEGEILARADKNSKAGVSRILKEYAARVEEDRKTRGEIKAPCKGIRVIVGQILAEGWTVGDKCRAAESEARAAFRAACVAYENARAAK